MLVHLAVLQERIATALADREAVVWRDRTFTYADVTIRPRQVGRALLRMGLGCRTSAT